MWSEDKIPMRVYIGLIILAYIFSIAIRYIWVHWASGYPQFFWNGELMINTNDGYYWAEGARDILTGHHQPNDLSPIDYPISILTAFLAKILPFKFETIILWMPAFFGSLLVVPVMMIAKTLGNDRVGVIAGFIVGIVWSYYNRTMTGYYDTDMLTIVLPTFALWFLILSFKSQKNRYLLLMALTMLLYEWWYPSARPLEMAFGGVALVYTLIFDRKNIFNYKVLIFIALAATPVSIFIKSILAVAIFIYFHFTKEKSDKFVLPILALSILLFLLMGGIDMILNPIKGYIFREAISDGATDSLKLHYFAIAKTVREAGSIPFEIFADRISGAIPLFIISTAGYILYAIKERLMWLALPMVGLGFIAMQGGLRFTVYAVPICALGFAYIAVWFGDKLAEYISDEKKAKIVKIATPLIALTISLYPNIEHIVTYKVPTVFKKDEVAVLDKLKSIASREDYVLTWWDYGYPIRYYSDVKTLIDGGKHTGMVNFPVSFALTHNQVASANMARLDVEYTEKAFKEKNVSQTEDYLADMMKDYGYKDPALFLAELDNPNFKLPKKSRDVYYYLPYRMLNIFPTVNLFSNLDLTTGKENKNPFFLASRYVVRGKRVYLSRNLFIDQEDATVHFGNNKYPVNTFVISYVGKDGKVHSQISKGDSRGNLYIIYLKSYGQILIMEKPFFDSAYIQMFALGRYDKNLFEPVIITPYAMVYKLKK